MILCDAAQVSEGKLYILGGGWNLVGPSPAPSALGLLIEVPWDRANSPFTLQLELHDQDAHQPSSPGRPGLSPYDSKQSWRRAAPRTWPRAPPCRSLSRSPYRR
ncbi:hypothetical protein FrEUN1fDRAFT_4632 [Parafrankia sp. EUN1f]|nr:hypothetical protein FrEUN1fDRAFT_4632 [Parafrankia sp. EUN1f]